MSLDGFSMYPLARELDNALAGGRIDKITQPNKQSIILSVRLDLITSCISPSTPRIPPPTCSRETSRTRPSRLSFAWCSENKSRQAA